MPEGRREIGIGLLGLGTVGRGVVTVLDRHAQSIAEKVGVPLRVRSVAVRDREKERPPLPEGTCLVFEPHEVIANADVDIVVELIGGLEPARTLILEALQAGKPVVTANKEVMASFGQEVLDLADAREIDVLFEASVGGGIPVIHPLKESLAGNAIHLVMGIVNGTTNYILTRMETGSEFDTALAEAQAKGFAEADPSADVEGRDAASKMAILASIAFGSRVVPQQVYTEGISNISLADMNYARELGFAVKLIGLAKEEEGRVDVRVHPTLIPLSHPLASVRDNFNAVFVEGDVVGELMFYGQGAGGLPTASAVVGDVIHAARNLLARGKGVGCTCFHEKPMRPIEEVETRYYLRMEVADRPGVLAQIARVFGENSVSLEKVLQTRLVEGGAEIIFVTHRSREGSLRKAVEGILRLPIVHRVPNVIRVEAPGV